MMKYIHKLLMGMVFIVTIGFGQHPPLFTEHIISNSAGGVFCVHATDVNEDGVFKVEH